MDITQMTALSLGAEIREGKLSAPEVTAAFLGKIEQKNPEYNVFITVCRDEAMSQAAKVQEKISRGEKLSPLAGVPIAVKDNICTLGVKTTCASRMLSDFVPPYDATVVKKLKDAGMIIIGKTNMDEFAMGTTGETSFFGAARHPLDTGRTPGGSSGGSAAAVLSGMAPCALGTDTGGSIRQPASYCGVVGMKPSYGAVSRYGVIAHGSSLEQVGPIAKTAEDCAAILDIISGIDERDSTTDNKNYDFGADKFGEKLKIGVVQGVFANAEEQALNDKMLECAKTYEKLGCEIERFSITSLDYAAAVYLIISAAEASSNLGRYDGVRFGHRAEAFCDVECMFEKTRAEGFGEEVRRRIMIGTFVLSSENYDKYYRNAQRARAKISEELDRAFSKYDLILCPSASKFVPLLGQEMSDSVSRYRSDINTVCANLVGLPALSMPCGLDKNGMPIGAQLIGRKGEDAKVLAAAKAFLELNSKEEVRR